MGLQSLPFFNDSCPNFVSNERLKMIHVFEERRPWLRRSALEAFGASHAARFFQDLAPAVAGLPRRRRRLSAGPLLYARAGPEMARQIRQPGCESECNRRGKRAIQSRPRAPSLKFGPASHHCGLAQRQSGSQVRLKPRLKPLIVGSGVFRRRGVAPFLPLVFDEPL